MSSLSLRLSPIPRRRTLCLAWRNRRAASTSNGQATRSQRQPKACKPSRCCSRPTCSISIKSIKVVANGREVFNARVERSLPTLLKWAARDNDRTMLYAAELHIDLDALRSISTGARPGSTSCRFLLRCPTDDFRFPHRRLAVHLTAKTHWHMVSRKKKHRKRG